MELSTHDVRHVARLARLALTEEETRALGDELSTILGYAEQIREVATEDVAPTSHAYPLRNVLRADEPGPSLAPHESLGPAPEAEDGRFRVPRIVEQQA